MTWILPNVWSGCVEALDAEHYLQELGDDEEENNARQQVSNQGSSLTGVGTAASAIDYELSSPSSALLIIEFGSGSSLCSFILRELALLLLPLTINCLVPVYKYQIKRNNFQKLHPVLNRIFYLKWPDRSSF